MKDLDRSESVEKASLEEINFNYSYDDENNYFFMNPKSFEQVQIKKEMVGEKGKLLTENLEVTLSFYNDGPIINRLTQSSSMQNRDNRCCFKRSDSFLFI